MISNEAVKILENFVKESSNSCSDELTAAIKKGIRALKKPIVYTEYREIDDPDYQNLVFEGM